MDIKTAGGIDNPIVDSNNRNDRILDVPKNSRGNQLQSRKPNAIASGGISNNRSNLRNFEMVFFTFIKTQGDLLISLEKAVFGSTDFTTQNTAESA